MDLRIASWNIRRICKELKQKEVRNFIAEENIQDCVVLETHLKTKSIGKACDFVFGKWRWISNVAYSPTSCRIVVGWNTDEVDIMIVQSCRQSILCLVEIIQSKVRVFVSFIYANNSCPDRRSLWTNLHMHKSLVGQQAWLDRIMVNDMFLNYIGNAHGIFLPYFVSDHSPAILNFPKCLIKKKKSFRFVNCVADKEEFSNTVREVWWGGKYSWMSDV
ncbi:RNA-directed DNA polymerase, eukaryota, reverse transcriptase zinc-binding domain protein [Tanacetum coccineum]